MLVLHTAACGEVGNQGMQFTRFLILVRQAVDRLTQAFLQKDGASTSIAAYLAAPEGVNSVAVRGGCLEFRFFFFFAYAVYIYMSFPLFFFGFTHAR